MNRDWQKFDYQPADKLGKLSRGRKYTFAPAVSALRGQAPPLLAPVAPRGSDAFVPDHRHRASSSRCVSVYSPAFTGRPTNCDYPRRDGQAEFSQVLVTYTETIYPFARGSYIPGPTTTNSVYRSGRPTPLLCRRHWNCDGIIHADQIFTVCWIASRNIS